jgi:hypothetical protein
MNIIVALGVGVGVGVISISLFMRLRGFQLLFRNLKGIITRPE